MLNIKVIHKRYLIRRFLNPVGRYSLHVASKISGGFWTIFGAVLAALVFVQAVQATEINIESTVSVPIEFMVNLEIVQMDRIVELLEALVQ